MKRFVSFVLVLALCLSFMPTVLAADDAKNAADTLYALGLFKGTGIDADGAPIYELDRPADRTEALVMLIRLLGQEAAAKECTAEYPFTDVYAWAEPYVAYAYEKGYTKGVSADEFGSSETATANMYITFVLRALGYKDSGESADFAYLEATSFAREVGLTDVDYSNGEFLRGDVAKVSCSALSAKLNGSEDTLIQSLVYSSAVSMDSAADEGFDVTSKALKEGESVTFEFYKKPGYFPEDHVLGSEILKYFPDARYYDQLNVYSEDDARMKNAVIKFNSIDEYANYCQLLEGYYGEAAGWNQITAFGADTELGYKGYFRGESNEVAYAHLFDENKNIVGTCTGYIDGVSVTYTRTFIDTSAKMAECIAEMDSYMVNRNSLEIVIDTEHPAANSWGSTDDTSHYYPATINGEKFAGQYALADFFNVYMQPEDEDALAIRAQSMFLLGQGMRVEHMSIVNKYYDSQRTEHYGVYLPDKHNTWLFVGAWDKDGNLLGYTIFEPNAE